MTTLQIFGKSWHQRAGAMLQGAVGVLLLAWVGWHCYATVDSGLRMEKYAYLAVSAGVAGLVGWLAGRVHSAPLRVLLRAFVVVALFWPFIPHSDVQWSSAFPPAGVWVWNGLQAGRPAVMEIISISGATLIAWVGGYALHLAFFRPRCEA